MQFRVLASCLGVVGLLGFVGCGGSTESSYEVNNPQGVIYAVASTPDGGDLVAQIGGDRVSYTVLTKGPDDPHMVTVKPSMALALKEADLLVVVGQGLEDFWLPDLIKLSGREDFTAEGGALLSMDQAIEIVQESFYEQEEGFDPQALAASLHPEGDPHYLLDPINGLRVAKVVRDVLIEKDPEGQAIYEANFDQFALKMSELLLGKQVVAAAGADVAAEALMNEKWQPLLEQAPSGDADVNQEAGLLARFKQVGPATFVGDHELWSYFAYRFGLTAEGYMEKMPGVSPSTAHLQGLVARMNAKSVDLILSAPYFDKKSVAFLANGTEAKSVPMTHQTQGVPEAQTYLQMCAFNAEGVLNALENK